MSRNEPKRTRKTKPNYFEYFTYEKHTRKQKSRLCDSHYLGNDIGYICGGFGTCLYTDEGFGLNLGQKVRKNTEDIFFRTFTKKGANQNCFFFSLVNSNLFYVWLSNYLLSFVFLLILFYVARLVHRG